MRKKIISIIASLSLMIVSIVPSNLVVAASDVVKKGTNDNIDWCFYSDGKLTLSGSGELGTGDWSSYKSAIKTVEISGGVTSIGSSAFNGYSFESLSLPDTLTTIASDSFYNCTNLKSLNIPSSVTKIGDYSFWNCTSLKEINIPDSVSDIGMRAFAKCTSVKKIIIGDGVHEIGMGAFSDDTLLSDVTFGNNITAISGEEFQSCTSLKSITIPAGVTTIGYGAFKDCTSLEAVNIPNGVTAIAQYAFWGCSKLREVSVPNTVTTLGINDDDDTPVPDNGENPGSFAYCSALESVTINKEAFTEARLNEAFYGTPWLLEERGGLSGAGGDCIFNLSSDGVLTINGPGNYKYLPSDYKGYNNIIKKVIINNDISGILQSAGLAGH